MILSKTSRSACMAFGQHCHEQKDRNTVTPGGFRPLLIDEIQLPKLRSTCYAQASSVALRASEDKPQVKKARTMKFTCPSCGQKLGVETIHSGQVVPCPGCGEEVTIPTAQELLKQSSDPTSYQVDLATPEEPAEEPLPEEPHQITSYQVDFSDPESLPPEKKAQFTKIKQTIQSQIDRGSMTITQFMADQDLEGGVDLQGTDGSTASNILTAEQGRKYKIGEVVKTGGMGAILDAKDANLRRGVAMKVLLDPKQATKEDVLRFIEEAQVTSQLQHPSIVPIYELGVDGGGNVFYTMKFIEGVTLKDVLRGIKDGDQDTIKEYPLARLLNIFQRVCDAIAFAHSKRVIHRDLKPENIMIGEYGEVQVMDWGIAKVLPVKKGKRLVVKGSKAQEREKKQSQKVAIDSVRKDQTGDILKTMAGSIMGTPGFMASEQALGETEQIDERTDIYALGAILYNILTLHPPVTGKDIGEMLRKVTTGKIVHPSQYNPKTGRRKTEDRRRKQRETLGTVALVHCPGKMIPDSPSAVCMKALSLRQVDRYQSVKRLQKDIEAYQGGFATSAEHAGLGRHIKLFFVRHKVVASLTAATIIGVFGGAVVATTQWIKAARSDKAAREALAALTGTAPALVNQSATHMEAGKLDEALKQITYACELDEKNAQYHLKRANVLQAMLQLTDAAKAYDKAFKLDLSLAVARENAELCRAVVKEYKGKKGAGLAVIGKLFRNMVQQNRYTDAMAMLRKHVPDAKNVEGFYRKMLKAKGVGITGLKVDEEGMIALDLSGTGISDLSPLKGMPLKSLNLAHGVNQGKVRDLSPLKGMPLTSLRLDQCPVADLSPLKGMRLTSLRIHCNNFKGEVSDLSPLRGMPLESLILNEHRGIVDLAPLRGMPLIQLGIAWTQVRDLSPLKSMKTLKTIAGIPAAANPLNPVNQALAAKDYAKAKQEAKKVIADWSDVPAMKGVVELAKWWIGTGIPFKKDPNAVPPQAKEFNGHQYLLIPVPMQWNDAKKFCESVGGHLVTITSKEEHAFVLQLCQDAKLASHCYIGFEIKDGKPAWITEEPWADQPYCPVSFISGANGGLRLRSDRGGKVGDLFTHTSLYPFIIEWDR